MTWSWEGKALRILESLLNKMGKSYFQILMVVEKGEKSYLQIFLDVDKANRKEVTCIVCGFEGLHFNAKINIMWQIQIPWWISF